MAKFAIVTDSVADLPEDVFLDLGIAVIPLNVRFGKESYRDGMDITAADFYLKLASHPDFPATSVPAPGDIAMVFDLLAEETDEIIALTVSARLSGTYEAFRQAIKMMQRKCPVEVIDTGTAVMAQGFAAMAAARAANEGAEKTEIIAAAKKAAARSTLIAAFDTLEYLKRGGRIGRAQAMMGSLLKIHPIITLDNGIVKPVTRRHSWVKAIDYLYDFAAGYSEIDEIAIEDSGTNNNANILIERLSAIFPREKIYRTRTSPVIGAHTGPGILVLTVKGKK